MASVFLSYDREDAARAGPIADALEKAGHSVWWDQHIKGGAQYGREIEEALAAADAVIVLWSKRSVESAWVRDEAAAGRDSGKLVPIRLDGAAPPMGFRQYQTIDLSSWKGRGTPARLHTILESVDALSADRPRSGTGSAPRTRPVPPARRIHAVFALIPLIAMVLAALFYWKPWAPDSAVPVVEVTGADSSAGARAMAHELLAKLGSLQAARADAVQLTADAQSSGADLRFAVGGSTEGQVSRVSLVLLDGRTGGLLWSKDFELPRSQQADLQQQVAFTAGRALDCALEGLAGERAGLERPVLKVYLNGCATIDELAYRDLYQLIPVFRQVTAQAPKFEGGWAKLVQVEALAALNNPAGDPALMALLKQHIAEARKINPHMAEAYLAEVELLSPTDYAGRLRLTDLATEHNPSHPEPFAARAYYLRFAGRMNDAVQNAKRASELDPLSPAIRNDYIAALMYAGQFDRARHELERAERLWPGATAVRSARFYLQMRYGDPRDALRLARSGISPVAPQLTESFLQARINPTADNIETAVRQALAHYRQDPASIGVVAQTLGAFGREEELFSILLDRREQAMVREGSHILFRPALRKFRHDPRFMQVAKRLGLIAYWQKSGKWPDFCFEPDLPYDCKAEAAKLFTRTG